MKQIGEALPSLKKYQGFIKPNTTPTPDDLFDLFLADLTGAELKILMYIVRRTYGFRKSDDSISLKQLCEGILTKTGKQLDRGTGLTKKTAIGAIKSLENRGLIVVSRVRSDDGDNLINVYKLKFR